MAHTRGRVVLLAYYLIYAFIYSGWLFQKSVTPRFFQYSIKYILFLILMLCPFFIPPIIILYRRRFGPQAKMIAIPVLVFIVVLYLLVSIYSRQTQQRLFDPFVQISPTYVGDVPKERSRQEPTFRILILGGSTSIHYPPHLQRILQKGHPQTKIEIVNGAQGEYTTKHSLINFVTYFQDWRPDVVIVMHGINDLVRSFPDPKYAIGPYNDRYTHYYGRTYYAANPPTLEGQIWKFLTWSWFRVFREREEDYPLGAYVSRKMHKRHLEQIVRYAKFNGAIPVVVSQASLYKKNNSKEERRILIFGRTMALTKRSYWDQSYPSNESLRRAMKAVNQTSREIALNGSALFVDGAEKVPRDVQHFVDDCHYTEQGNEVLSQAIADVIDEAGLIGRGHE